MSKPQRSTGKAAEDSVEMKVNRVTGEAVGTKIVKGDEIHIHGPQPPPPPTDAGLLAASATSLLPAAEAQTKIVPRGLRSASTSASFVRLQRCRSGGTGRRAGLKIR